MAMLMMKRMLGAIIWALGIGAGSAGARSLQQMMARADRANPEELNGVFACPVDAFRPHYNQARFRAAKSAVDVLSDRSLVNDEMLLCELEERGLDDAIVFRGEAAHAAFSAMHGRAIRQAVGALDLIAAERQRQVVELGFSAQRDDAYALGELSLAASAYAAAEDQRAWHGDPDSFKPATDDTPESRIRELVKAGALIIAEIERLQRLQAMAGAE